jgi:branched-chain amino acid transport system ATP-binding protein
MAEGAAVFLEAVGIEVRFGGVQALDCVTLHADVGLVTGVMGPNGAGKTTLLNVVGGQQRTTRGRVMVGGEDVTRLPPHRRARLGVARTFQRLEMFGILSVRDSILVSAEIRRRWAHDKADPVAAANSIIETLGLTDLADERADNLPTGLARLVDIGRALATQPRLLLLDEPASGLDETEVTRLARVLDTLARDGRAVLLVEHDVDLVFRVSSRVYALDAGRVIAEGPPELVQSDEAVRAAYFGDLASGR